MADLLTIAFPFFALLAAGFGVGRLGAIPPAGRSAIEFFALNFALPALFFRMVAVTPYAELPDWTFILTTTFATYCAFAVAFSLAALVNRGHIAEATVIGLGGASSNIALLAPGLVVAAFGPQAGAPVALIYAADLCLLAALAPLMMTLGGTEQSELRPTLRRIGLAIGRNPIFIAAVLGLLATLVHLRLPGPIDRLLTVLGSAAPPVALFAVGLDLAGRSFGPPGYASAIILPVKLIVHPLIVYLLLGWIGSFPAPWIDAALVMAALPTAATLVAQAGRYGAGEKTADRAVLLTALAAAVTLIILLALIADGVLPADPFR